MNNFKKIYSKNYILFHIIFNVILALCLIMGNFIYQGPKDDIFIIGSFSHYITLFLFTVFFLMAISFLCPFFTVYLNHFFKKAGKFKNAKHIWFLFPILVTVFSVVYLGYFPGILAYDTPMQMPQALNLAPFNGHHPIMHTLLISFCMHIGSFFAYEGAGIVIYSIIQILVFSWGLTYITYILASEYRYRFASILVGICFSIYPTFALFSFNVTKDVLFSIFFNLFVIRIFLILKHNYMASKSERVETVLYAILLGQFRNNGIYVLLVFSIVLLFYKRYRKTGFMLAFMPFLFCTIINAFFFNVLGFEKSPSQEKIPIPIHQIEAVYIHCGEELDNDTKAAIVDFMPQISWYNPSNVDITKKYFNTYKYDTNISAFWKLWFQLGKEHPLEYIKSAIHLNIEFWYPFHTYNNEFRDIQYVETSLAESTVKYVGDIKRKSIFPRVLTWFEKYANCQFPIMNNWLLGFIFSISFPFFFMYECILQIISRKKCLSLLFFLPYTLLWLTYIIGPLSNVRYMLPFFIMIPSGLMINILEIEV